MPTDLVAALAALFGSAFLSATLLPGSSELAFVALLAHWPDRSGYAIAAATAGNTLGGVVSYALGRLLPTPRTSGRAVVLVRRYGTPALLFSWVPVIGDALCVASGWLRQPWPAAALAMAIGKALRYVAVAEGIRWWNPVLG